MCVENCPPPSNRLTRRGVLAGAAALAGTTAALAAAPGASAAAPMTRTSAARSGSAPRGGDLVIDGGTLLDPATGDVTEDAVVVIRDGVVRAAGKRKNVDVPTGATVLDAHGQWVLPGLVDSHIHLNTAAEAARTLALGATTARSGSTNFYQDIAVRELSRQAPGLAPGLRAAGIFVTPDLGDTILADPDLTPLARLKGGVTSTEALRRVVEVNLARGVDTVKTRVNPRAGLAEQDPLEQVYSREQLSTIVATARRGGKDVLCHSYSEQGCHDAVMAGVKSVEHGAFISERTLREMRRRGTYFTPTMVAIGGMIGDPDPVLDERGRTYLPKLKAAAKLAHELGVGLVSGTDSSGGSVEPIGAEIEMMHSAGLSALDAIRTATTNAARLLGFEGKVGRLARGYAGDAILLSGDPLADISVLKKPVRVVRSGVAV